MSILVLQKPLPKWNWRLGTLGYLGCFICTLVVSIVAPGWHALWALGMALVLAFVFYPQALVCLRQRSLWIFVVFLVGSSTLVMGSEGGDPGGLALGIQMALRAISIMIAVAGFSACVSIGELAALLERVGMGGLGFALGIAVNMLPMVQATLQQTFYAMRLRGGFRQKQWRAIRLLLVAVIVNTLRYAEDIVNAAEARAFDPTSRRGNAITWKRADGFVIGVLALATLGLLLV